MATQEAMMSVLGSKKHSIQQDLWRQDIQSLDAQNRERVEDVSRQRYQFYKIAGLCLIFQGVILTAVSQTHRLNCSHVWSPLLLSALVAASSILAAADTVVSIADGELKFLAVNGRITNYIKALDELDRVGSLLNLKDCRDRYQLNEIDEDRDEQLADVIESTSAAGDDSAAASSRFWWSKEGLQKIVSPTYLIIFVFLLTFSLLVEFLSFRALCDGCP